MTFWLLELGWFEQYFVGLETLILSLTLFIINVCGDFGASAIDFKNVTGMWWYHVGQSYQRDLSEDSVYSLRLYFWSFTVLKISSSIWLSSDLGLFTNCSKLLLKNAFNITGSLELGCLQSPFCFLILRLICKNLFLFLFLFVVFWSQGLPSIALMFSWILFSLI